MESLESSLQRSPYFYLEWGNFAIDDEGRPAQKNVLIQDGVLTDYMYDQIRARKEGRPSSGNGRRQSYQHLPMVRMTNTFVLDGPDDPGYQLEGLWRAD